jgi:hypothetical protein
LLVSILLGVDATAVYKRGLGPPPLVGIIFTSHTHTHVSYFSHLVHHTTLHHTTPHHTTTFNHTSWVSSATTTTTTTRRRATTRALPTAVPSKAPAVLAVLAVLVSVALRVALNITAVPVARVVLEDLVAPVVTTEALEVQVDLADLRVALNITAAPVAPVALEALEVPVALAVTREVYVYPSLIDGGAFADVRIARWLVKGLIDCHGRRWIYHHCGGFPLE